MQGTTIVNGRDYRHVIHATSVSSARDRGRSLDIASRLTHDMGKFADENYTWVWKGGRMPARLAIAILVLSLFVR